MLCQTHLAGKKIDYELKRSQRRSIGLKISHLGLQVSAPFGLPITEVDSVLHNKADWILKKLAIWQNKTPLNSAGTEHINGLYPLLGVFWKPALSACGQIQMTPAHDNGALMPSGFDTLFTPEQTRKWIMAWYHQQAITCFSERITLYANKLNVPKPPFKLSQARTRWGSCNSRGIIRLNWCLIQMPLHLVDYVVTHELCHLIEMNHSRAFWILVESVYPDYLRARRELKAYKFNHPVTAI
ncbi:MAG TPA: M48 family peptidase [Nitrosomonas sp.]|nr:M48 family peptidase [Nitrosomonas sp.]